jgi:hypothetical protein
MEIFFNGPIQIIKNSVVCEDYPKNNKKDEKLRQLLLEKGIFEQGKKHIIYAVRADERKNIEEALFITAMLSYISPNKTPYKLIVTASREKDYKNPEENKYQRGIEKFAQELGISCSIGHAYKYIDDNEFNISNLYHAGDIAITTSFKEGFGYAYVEPWVSGVPVIGRWIREVCEDFEMNGMKLKDIFYDNSVLYSKGTPEERMKYFAQILNDKKNLEKFAKKLNLEKRLHLSNKYLGHNANIIRDVYGHDVVATDLIKLYKLPGYQKLD